jgi:hypothetical protein
MNLKVKSLLFFCTLCLISNYANVKAQNSSTDKKVFRMLKEFYTSYITSLSIISPLNIEKADSIKLKYCDVTMLNNINNQFKKGELDFDPFLKAQDIDSSCLKTLSFSKDLKRPNTFAVYYISNHIKTVIYLKVAKENSIYKIKNVW